MTADVHLVCLRAGARMELDRLGVPTITASCREDAAALWGYAHARHRFFQMDVLRRAASGRMAELFGETALALDRQQRMLNLDAVAERAWNGLPPWQKHLLEAYAEGANAGAFRTIEHRLLRRNAEPWRPCDSLLVMLRMYQTLAFDLEGALAWHTMCAALPREVAEFLAPRADEWAALPTRPAEVPVTALARILEQWRNRPPANHACGTRNAPPGSNCWAVAGNRTRGGAPMLVNDMHLPLGVPNIWHRACLRYGETDAVGIAIPGLPILAAGSSAHMAWGLTNLPGDTLRLTELPVDHPVAERRERIDVAFGDAEELVFLDSPAGPLLPGSRIALDWSGSWPGSVHVGLFRLAEAESMEEAMAVAWDGGCPPLNILFAHGGEGIACTLAGRLPRRSNAEDREFLPPASIPRRINPDCGMLVSANDPPDLADCKQDVGWNYPSAYRRHRIAELLSGRTGWTEEDMLAVQQDIRAGLYDFYHTLAMEAVAGAPCRDWPASLLREVKDALADWNGQAEGGSRALPLVFAFRQALADSLIGAFLRPCTQADPKFRYAWRNPEPPLRALLQSRHPALVPDGHADWNAFLAHVLRAAATDLVQRHRRPLSRLRWRNCGRTEIRHILGRGVMSLLNLAPLPTQGAADCVFALAASTGPANRMAVSPGAWESALFAMPGGQSGNPFSRHYRDHHRAWLRGRPLPFLPGRPRSTRKFAP